MRIVDPDLQRREASLEIESTLLGAFLGAELSFDAAVYN
jgi:hypothetical protein